MTDSATVIDAHQAPAASLAAGSDAVPRRGRRRRWPYAVATTTPAIAISLAAINRDLSMIGGGWSLLWFTVLAVGAFLTARVRANIIGPILMLYGTAAGLSGIVISVAAMRSPEAGTWYEALGWAVNTAALMLIPVALLRFPDGKLLGRRWRLVEYGVGLGAAVGALAAAVNNGWGGDVNQARTEGVWHDQLDRVGDLATAVFFPAVSVAMAAALISLVIRYRQGDGVLRHQLRWLIYAVSLAVVVSATVGRYLSNDLQSSTLDVWFYAAVFATIPLAIAVAVVKYRLYDIDVIISRTLLYGSMLTAIGVVYVAIVFGLGSVLGRTATDSPVLPLAATVLVALAVQPLRSRLERWANRLVFGRRATPYEVLSDFTQRVAATDDRLLADVARSLVDGTTATAVSVWTMDGEMLRAVSSWPPDHHPSSSAAFESVSGDGALVVPGADEAYPIRQGDRTIGALGLHLAAGEQLSPGDRALVGELTAGIGLALHNRELTDELEARVDALRASRHRLVMVQDAARHRLERNLHDGAQQRLVAVKVRLSIAQQMATKAGADSTASDLADLCQLADGAIESLRNAARGVYPPLLEAEGLEAALGAQLDRSPIAVDLTCNLERRYGRDVEVTVYLAATETINALERAAPVREAAVVLTDDGDRLVLQIGADVAVQPPAQITERIDAVGGTVIGGNPPTILRAVLPLAADTAHGRSHDVAGPGSRLVAPA